MIDIERVRGSGGRRMKEGRYRARAINKTKEETQNKYI